MVTRIELGRYNQNELFSKGRLFVLELPDEAKIHKTPHGPVELRFEQDEESGNRFIWIKVDCLPTFQTRGREICVSVSPKTGEGRINLDRTKVLYVRTGAKPEQFRSVRKRR